MPATKRNKTGSVTDRAHWSLMPPTFGRPNAKSKTLVPIEFSKYQQTVNGGLCTTNNGLDESRVTTAPLPSLKRGLLVRSIVSG